MASTIIANIAPYTFGQMTNQAVARLVSLNTQLARLQEAIATASSGYEGAPGTEFEIRGNSNMVLPTGSLAIGQNLFGVLASSVAGEQGQSYSYAVGQLYAAWQTFWAAAAPYIEQLDNGASTP
jgi:hypothetical protein